MKKSIVSILMIVLLSGCTSAYKISPNELDKLKGMINLSGTNGQTSVVVRSIRHVQTTEGKMVSVVEPYSLIITGKRGKKTKFSYPIKTEKKGNVLYIAGGNIGQQEFELGKIDSLEIEVPDFLKTSLLVTGISLAAAAVTIGVVYALVL